MKYLLVSDFFELECRWWILVVVWDVVAAGLGQGEKGGAEHFGFILIGVCDPCGAVLSLGFECGYSGESTICGF